MKPIFRNAMFGFNKEDVFHFITKQSKQYEQKISDISAEKEKIQKELIEDKELCEAKLAEVEASFQKVDDTKTVLCEVKALLSNILESEETFSRCISSCNENASSMKNNILLLKEQVTQCEVYREKATRFDQLSSALSGIFGNGEQEQAESVSDSAQPLTEYSTESFQDLTENYEKLSANLKNLFELCEKLDLENE